MGLIFLVVGVFFFSAVESASTKTATHGTVVAEDLSNNLVMINQNMYNGVTSMTNPLIKFAVDTAPNLAHMYAIFNGVNIPPSLAALAKNLYGKVAVGGGRLAGNTAVLGSSVLESSMKLGSHGLQAGNDVVEAAGKSGMNLAGKLSDHVAAGTSLGADIIAANLKLAGDGMLVGSVGANVLSQGISEVIDAIGGRLIAAISTAEKTASQLLNSRVKVLKDGTLDFENKAQKNVYNALMSYIEILTHVQNLFNQFASIVSGVYSAASVVSASVSNSSSTSPSLTVKL